MERELADGDRFAARSVDAVRSDEVQTVIAEQVAVALLERASPDLVSSRPLVITAVAAALETEQFEEVLRRSALTAHAVLLEGDRDVLVELEQAREVLVPALRTASPELARQIPSDVSPRIAEIRRSDAATWVVRVADGAGPAAYLLLIAALACLGVAIRRSADRRGALITAGGVLAGAAVVGLGAVAALRAEVVSGAGQLGILSEEDARAAAAATWEALAGDLAVWLAVMGAVGVAAAAGGLLAEARVDRAAALRHAADVVAGGRLSRTARLARGVGLAVLGVLILSGAQPLVAAAVVVLGAALVVLGSAEAISTAPRPRRPRTWPRPSPRALAAGAAVLVVAGAGAGVVAVVAGDEGPPAPPPEGERGACNGLVALCGRRLDQVVLAGTHNSMSAADRPGWFFANQVRPVPRQLRDGIRLLMIDAHYGVVDARGRVRTDLRAEGTSRNRVSRQLGAEAVGAAERLAGRLGLVPSEGEREIFLCHTLCELGAERMGSTLGELRGFLERNRSEVVVVLVESSVDPGDVEHEFEEADLEPYLATLRRGRPLPTLGEMVASGRRLVVLDQGDGGEAEWYGPAFVHLQDTRVGSLLESRTACEAGRGTAESPLFLMNHWIDRFPPPFTANSEVGGREALLRRVRSCRERQGRRPNMIAVDFYDRGDVVAVARELNRRGPG